MLEQSNNTPKIRLIDETKYYATSKQPSNKNIRLLTKEEAEIMRQPKLVGQPNTNINHPQTQFPQFHLFPLQIPPLKFPMIENPKPKVQVERSRSRSPRKEIGRLSSAEVDHYTLQILNAFQKADEKRRQLQNRHI
ncbi:hypothetical protein pb186bvf_018038 [Paramecium bursaria]